MRILLTNDDGIYAPGLAVLERIARTLSDDVWTCAPETEQSGASRALTLLEPLRVRRLGERRFAIKGTPTDCVMLGMQTLVEGAKPDLVLSGVNQGSNLADDVSLSGTVAAAIEAMTMGVPAIALSQMLGATRATEPEDFRTADTFATGVIQRLLAAGWPKGVVLNVNFPAALPTSDEIEVTRQGTRDARARFVETRVDPRGRDYHWITYTIQPSNPAPGTDLAAAYAGKISVTPLHIDLTHVPTVRDLSAALARQAREPAT